MNKGEKNKSGKKRKKGGSLMILTCFTVWSFVALALTAEAPSGQDAHPIVHTWVGLAQVYWHFSL